MKKLLEYIILVFGLLIGIISFYSIADSMIGSEHETFTDNLQSATEVITDLNKRTLEKGFSKFLIDH